MTCQARQYSDQMLCRCGLAWDVNDPAPPKCIRAAHSIFDLVPRKIWVDQCSRRLTDHPLLLRIDSFLAAYKNAGIRIRQIKMSTREFFRLKAELGAPYAFGRYRGVPIRLTVDDRWTKDTQ